MIRSILSLSVPALLGGALLGAPPDGDPEPAPPVDFARQIRPILAERCFDCHGPDDATREAELRLDTPEGLFGDRGGYAAVAPGELAASELWLRVADASDPMPPESSGEVLEEGERELLRRWIEEGAAWSRHWALEAPARPAEPPVRRPGWVRNGIDAFVLARLEAEGLEPSPEADRAALLRRASYDLTGLPPTLEELDAFLTDTGEDAYERAVDRLLASPRYGERQAEEWLDLARYADTNGDGYDGTREMWKWREWVIGAFNANQPFDEFTVEQIAGDLLPGATRSQRLATGFQRNHTIFTKPGAADDEYRHAYVVDRVNTTATVWMGLTLACAQCHDHKYDPFSQAEYYSLYAYFNNVSEDDVGRGRGNTRPVMVVPDAEQGAELDSLAERIEELDGYLTGDDAELDAGQERWAREALERLGEPVEWVPIEPAGSLSLGGALLELQEDGSILATGPSPAADVYHVVARPGRARITALRLEVLPHESFENGGSGRSEKGTFQLNELEVYLSLSLIHI